MMKVLYIEGDCASEIDMDIDEFTGPNVLAFHVAQYTIAPFDDWELLDDFIIDGMHYIQVGECVEGDTAKYIRRVT